MTPRAFFLAAGLAMGIGSSATASVIEYTFEFLDDTTSDVVVNGLLLFPEEDLLDPFDPDAPLVVIPDEVLLYNSPLGGLGSYTIAEEPSPETTGEGFTFDKITLEIIDADLIVYLGGDINSDFWLEFGLKVESSTSGRRGRHVLSCTDMYSGLEALRMCPDDVEVVSVMTVRYNAVEPDETTPVPLPAGLPLLLAGVGAFAGVRTLRKRS